MHEEKQGPDMGESCSRHGELLVEGLPECTEVDQSMVPGSTQHGEQLENTTQPSASQGKARCQTKDMGRVCSPRNRNTKHQEESSNNEQVEGVGDVANVGRQSVHTEEESELVKPCGPVCVSNVLQLLEYQSYRCALTGRKLTPETAALDHIVPIRHGGEHVIENAQVLHKDANRAKGSLTADEFVQLCREVVKWDRSKKGRN